MAQIQPGMQYQAGVVHQQVVTAQPVISTTTVISQQPGMRDWSSGLCDCFQDIKSCCCAYFCQNFYYCCIAQRMGENCCVGYCGDDAGCVPGGHLAMRSKFRAQHNIQGDICGDCCVMHFCKPCAMCQLAREMDRLGYMNNGC